MSRPIKYDDEALLESLRATFLELGPGATSAALARRAGVSEGTLFKRFGTKQRLFELALRISPMEDQEWFQRMMDRAGEGSLHANLAELARSLMEFMTEATPVIETLMRSGFKPSDMRDLIGDQEAPPLVLQRRLEKYLEREMRLGRMRKVDSNTLADLLLGACMKHVHLQAHFGDLVGNESIEQVAQRVASLIVQLTAPIALPASARASAVVRKTR